MKLKKILFICIILFLLFIIYLANIDKKVYYLNLGDSLILGNNLGNEFYSDEVSSYLLSKGKLEVYNNSFYIKNMRTTDLINMIDDNYKNSNGESIKHALIKADFLTISIGSNDILNEVLLVSDINDYNLYDYVDEIMDDIDELLSKIRTYCKEDIVIIGYYNITNNEDIFLYMNKKLKLLANKYGINYVDIYEDIKNNPLYLNSEKYELSKLGKKEISKKIIKEIDMNLLK